MAYFTTKLSLEKKLEKDLEKLTEKEKKIARRLGVEGKELERLAKRESMLARQALRSLHTGSTVNTEQFLKEAKTINELEGHLKNVIQAKNKLNSPSPTSRKSPPRMSHKNKPPSPQMSKAARRRTEALRAARDVPEGGRRSRRQRK